MSQLTRLLLDSGWDVGHSSQLLKSRNRLRARRVERSVLPVAVVEQQCVKDNIQSPCAVHFQRSVLQLDRLVVTHHELTVFSVVRWSRNPHVRTAHRRWMGAPEIQHFAQHGSLYAVVEVTALIALRVAAFYEEVHAPSRPPPLSQCRRPIPAPQPSARNPRNSTDSAAAPLVSVPTVNQAMRSPPP